MIQHIVLFNPKVGLADDDIRSYAQTTIDVLTRCPHVERFTLGRRVEIDPGYTRSFGDKTYGYAAVVEFENPGALVAYLTSPDHHELGRLFWEMCESTVVVEVEVAAGTNVETLETLT